MHEIHGASDLVGLFVIAGGMALAGSLHCLGMCGGFAVLSRTGTAGRSWPRFSAYGAGKTLTYMLIGVLAGSLGQVVALNGTAGRALAVLAGLVMIGMGVQLGGWLPVESWLVPRVPERLKRALSSMVADTTARSRFLLGLLNGVLPCGLLYAALAVAATAGTWWAGGLVMLVFGVGTLPSLWLASHAARLLGPGRNVLLARVGAVVVILFGIITLLRGSAWLRMLLMS